MALLICQSPASLPLPVSRFMPLEDLLAAGPLVSGAPLIGPGAAWACAPPANASATRAMPVALHKCAAKESTEQFSLTARFSNQAAFEFVFGISLTIYSDSRAAKFQNIIQAASSCGLRKL